MNTSWWASVRLDRPVSGCELVPHAYLHQKNCAPSNQPQEVPRRSGNCELSLGACRVQPCMPEECQLVFRWLRGPRRAVCANEECARRFSFSPLDWSNLVQREQSVQCVCCMKAGRERCAPPPPHDRRPRTIAALLVSPRGARAPHLSLIHI